MTALISTPSILLGGGSFGNPAGLSNPGELEVAYENLLSGAAEISETGAKSIVLGAGAIGTAGYAQLACGETVAEVQQNAAVLKNISQFCIANDITIDVLADLTNGATYGTGADEINALVDQWATAAAVAGLPIGSVSDVQEIGASQPPSSFASIAAIEANAVHTVIKDYSGSSYEMTNSNLAVGDMEFGGASNATEISQWWSALDQADQAAGVAQLSSFTTDIEWFQPWTSSTWQSDLTSLAALAHADNMAVNVTVQGSQADASSYQSVQQAEQTAIDLAKLQALGTLSVNNLTLQSWDPLPIGVGDITAPTSTVSEAAQINAVYPLYLDGAITANGAFSFAAPGQIVLNTGVTRSVVPLTVQWDAPDVQAGNRLGVVIIDQTGSLTATQYGAGSVSHPDANILILSGNSADLAWELASVSLSEGEAGADTIDIETYGSDGRLADNQISVFAAASGQPVTAISSTASAQGWLSSSAAINTGTVAAAGSIMTSETLIGAVANTGTSISPTFVATVGIHEPLAEYGVADVQGIIPGAPVGTVEDVYNPAVDNGAFGANGYANNPGQNNVVAPQITGWLGSAFNAAMELVPLIVQSTVNTFNPVSGLLESSSAALAPDPMTVVDATGPHADTFASAFNTGGTQVVEYNTGDNPGWQAAWGNQFNSVTITCDGAGQKVEEFFQGGPANPWFTIDDVFSPTNGQLWEVFQSTAPPPMAAATGDYVNTSNPYQPGFVTGPKYVTQFAGSPNWDGIDWGYSASADTELQMDFITIGNFTGYAVDFPAQYAADMNAYAYEFVNGSTLDLINLPGEIDVNLNSLGQITLNSQRILSGLSGLSTIDASGATGAVTLVGLATGGSTLVGGDGVSTLTGSGSDTFIAESGSTTIQTGIGGSTILVASATANVTLSGNNNVVTAVAGSVITVTGTAETVNGSNITVSVGSGSSVTVAGSNDTINLIGPQIRLHGGAGNSVFVSDTAADVGANMSALEALAAAGELVSIIFTDPGTPILRLSEGDVTADAAALSRIRSHYIIDPNVADALAAVTFPNVTAIAIVDTAANVVANIDALQTLAAVGKLASINFTDGSEPTLTLSAAQQTADANAIALIATPYTLTTTGQTIIDAQTNILVHNVSGQLALWQMNGTAIATSGLLGPNPGSSALAVGTGAFYAGDTSDVVLQNQDGSVAVWEVQGSTVLGQATVAANPGTTWHIKGTGSFYADGNTDILWQNDNGSVALWDMNGSTIVQSALVAANPGPTWHIEGTGNFYGDGNTDIVWQNDNGSVALWDLSGSTIVQSGLVSADPGTTWHIKGTGDFYGDGNTDILWQNDNGSVAIWDMHGTTIVQSGLVAANPGPTWHIEATGDFNSDGKTDIAWQSDSGAVAVWEMNGTTIAGSGLVATPGTSWNLLGSDENMRFIYSGAAGETLAATPQTSDEFVFNNFAAGDHTITGFSTTQDMIELSVAQFASFADVQAATTAVPGGTAINLGHSSSLLLQGIDPSTLHASNFALA